MEAKPTSKYYPTRDLALQRLSGGRFSLFWLVENITDRITVEDRALSIRLRYLPFFLQKNRGKQVTEAFRVREMEKQTAKIASAEGLEMRFGESV